MTKNVTLRINEQLLQKARHVAVDHHMSLSAWMASLLAEAVEKEEGYAIARARAEKRLNAGFRLGGTPLTRESIHER